VSRKDRRWAPAELEEDRPFLKQPFPAAAVICRTEQGNLHAGVLYKNRGEAAILHLGWEDLLSRNWRWRRLWAAPDVEPERLLSVAALCKVVWDDFEQSRTFPYALRYLETSFDAVTGKLRLAPGAKGLTCATFILAVFNAVGIVLVQEDLWPVRQKDDRKFLDHISRHATMQHLAILTAEVEAGVRRIRPDEVLGACACPLPATFACARTQGDAVLAKLPDA
jgi:hypothetical protein